MNQASSFCFLSSLAYKLVNLFFFYQVKLAKTEFNKKNIGLGLNFNYEFKVSSTETLNLSDLRTVAPIQNDIYKNLQKSHVMCLVSDVRCHVSNVACHVSLTQTATATDPPSAKSLTMHSRRQQAVLLFQNISLGVFF